MIDDYENGAPGPYQTGAPGSYQTGAPGSYQTGAPGSYQTGAPGSYQTGAPDPSGTGAPDPSGTGAPDPSGTGAPDPSGTGAPDPSGTGAPDPSGTGAPDPSGTGAPDPSGTGAPDPSGTGAPDPSGTGAPDPSGTGAPDPSGTGAPDPYQTGAPDPYQTGAPDPYQTGAPDPYQTGAPDPYQTGAPDPFQTGAPDPFQTGAPDPYQTGAPGPYQTGAPGPYQTGAPGPYQTGAPGPYQTGAPGPYQTGAPGPYQTGAPDPYQTGAPDPYQTGGAVEVDLGNGQSVSLALDAESDAVNLSLDLDLSAFDVFKDDGLFSSALPAQDDVVLYGPAASDPPSELFILEARAESMTVFSAGDAVRHGELDSVQIGDAQSADMVSGEEKATISGKLRERTGGDLHHIAGKVETTIGGRMSITAGFEDSILLGGTMTDTWAGPTLILAVMSDDLCAGGGARVTTAVDLWLNNLTGMEERPGTAAADGVLVEGYGTLFEREYGPSAYAVGSGIWSGTTYVTTKSGVRPLMRVAAGVRNLVPGAGAAAGEQAPPSPPPAPTGSAAGAGMVTGTVAMTGAGIARTGANVSMSIDGLADLARAGEASADAADMRHAGDTASQLEDLRTGALNHRVSSEEISHIDMVSSPTYASAADNIDHRPVGLAAEDPYASPYSEVSNAPPTTNPAPSPLAMRVESAKYSLVRNWNFEKNMLFPSGDVQTQIVKIRQGGDALDAKMDAASRLQDAVEAVNEGKDPRPGLLGSADYLESFGYTDEAAKLREAAAEYDAFLDSMKALTPDGEPPPGVLDYGKEFTAQPDWHNPARPRPTTPRDLLGLDILPGSKSSGIYEVVPAVDASDVVARQDALVYEWRVAANRKNWELSDSWYWDAPDSWYGEPDVSDVGDPNAAGRLEAQQIVANQYAVAAEMVARGEDPRRSLEGAATLLEENGRVAEAVELRDLIEQYEKFLDSVRRLDPQGDLPPEVVVKRVNATPTSDLPDWHDPTRRRPTDPRDLLSFNFPGARSSGIYDEIGGAVNPNVVNFPRPSGLPVDHHHGLADALLDLTPTTARAGGAGTSTTDALDLARTPYSQLDVPSFRFRDPDVDDIRRVVAVDPQQALDAAEDVAGGVGRRIDSGSGAFDAASGVETGPARLDMDPNPSGIGPPAQPQIDEGGARWGVDAETRSPDPDTGEFRPQGDYADVSIRGDAVQDGAGADAGTAQAVPPDTLAVVDAMPGTSVGPDGAVRNLAVAPDTAQPDWRYWFSQVDNTGAHSSTDWEDMSQQMNKSYMDARRGCEWRSVIAYGDAINQMRTDLTRALVELAGYSEDAANAMPDSSAAYRALATAVDEAGNAEDWDKVKRLSQFLDAFDLRTQDTLTDLASRSDELSGTSDPLRNQLDRHIDNRKLRDEFTRRMEAATLDLQEAMGSDDVEAINTANRKVDYYHQIQAALDEGRNPLVESSEQIAYLRATGRNEQADLFTQLQGDLVSLLDDPEYHKSASQLGANTYAPGSAVRPDLSGRSDPTRTENYVPGAVDNIDMQSFLRAEVDESGGAGVHGDTGVPANAGTYDTGRDLVNGQVGSADFVQAPAEEPTWVGGPELKSILKEPDPDPAEGGRYGPYGPDAMGEFVPAPTRGWEPGGFLEDGPTDLEWSDGRPWSVRDQLGNVMMQHPVDPTYTRRTSAEMVGRSRTADFAEARRIVDPGYRRQQAARIAAANEFWGAMPKVDPRSWKSPTQRAAKGISFGESTMTVFDVGKSVEDMVDGVDAGQAIRHVEMPNARWAPTRQPGFGRTASSAGDFPFSLRERLVNALMQGQRLDAESMAKLKSEFVSARTTRYSSAASKSDWLKMAMTLRDIDATHLPRANRAPSKAVLFGPEYAGSIDGKTLGKLLDLFESSSTLA